MHLTIVFDLQPQTLQEVSTKLCAVRVEINRVPDAKGGKNSCPWVEKGFSSTHISIGLALGSPMNR